MVARDGRLRPVTDVGEDADHLHLCRWLPLDRLSAGIRRVRDIRTQLGQDHADEADVGISRSRTFTVVLAVQLADREFGQGLVGLVEVESGRVEVGC